MSPLTPEEIATAIATPRYAALAGLQLDLPSLTTYDPALVRDTRLLVPIDVRALLVATAGSVRAVPTETIVPVTAAGTADADVLPVPPPLFVDQPVDRPVGVHLHWAMPDGLTRGDAGAARSTAIPAGNPTGLPPLPDRWVVVRMRHDRSTIRSWVLESDRGEHHDLAGWIERGPVVAGTTTGASGRRVILPAGLNVAAGGELAWAATYDAVVDRFAFHDDLADIPAGQRHGLVFSYLIAGWWSDADLDPLRDCSTVGAYHDRTAWLGWLAPEPIGLTARSQQTSSAARRRGELHVNPSSPADGRTADMTRIDATMDKSTGGSGKFVLPQGPSMPTVTLLHGTVVGVTLDGGPDLAPAATAISVAVGPSGYAALSALLADGSAAARVASERVLAAFSSGLLSTIDGPNGLAAVDEDRHASTFVGFSGGHRGQPDRVAEGDIMSTAPYTRPYSHTTAGTAKGSPAEKAERRMEVRLTKRSEDAVLFEANKKRTSTTKPGTTPRTFRDIDVPGPRSFVPVDLAFVLRGATRSFRHGGDGRFTTDGRLACRLASQVISGYQGMLEQHELPSGLRTVGSGAVPPEVDMLLREAVLTDPYHWSEISAWAETARGLPAAAVTNRVKAELALRSVAVPTRGESAALGDDAAHTLRKASLVMGDDPSPVSATRWAQPWVPLWCEWEIEIAVDDSLARWTLGDTDFEISNAAIADAATTRTVSGRALLTSASSRSLAAKIRQWLSDEDARDLAGQGQLSEGNEAELAAAALAADGLDVIGGSFGGVRETLLGLNPLEAARVPITAAGAVKTPPLARELPTLLAGGAATIKRLRVVDAFGRWRDIPASSLTAAEIATTIAHASGAPHVTLPPRIQRPCRIAVRFVDPDTADGDANVEARIDQEHPDLAISPIAGWLMPDHVDEALECFDSAGNPLGQLMHDDLTGAVVWEGAPGRPGPIGGAPDPGSDPGARHVTRFAAGLVAADAAARNSTSGTPAETALSALLRGIDTTLWTVDPLGSIGTASVAGLVGRPIAVVRALLRFDVLDDMSDLSFATEADRAARQQRFTDLAVRTIVVRLGTLTRTDDSLLAYAVDDDYSRIRLVAPEVRNDARVSGRQQGQLRDLGHGSTTPPSVNAIDHPYVNGETDVTMRSGQTVRLTLFMNPGGKVHVTTGLLPRKSLALAHDWFDKSLARLSPSFRVGPVLVDPTTIRLPLITGLGNDQTFTRRDTPLGWRDDPITAATQSAYLPEQPSVLQEGWIRVQQEPDGGTTGTPP